jgi:hypothetical protein
MNIVVIVALVNISDKSIYSLSKRDLNLRRLGYLESYIYVFGGGNGLLMFKKVEAIKFRNKSE